MVGARPVHPTRYGPLTEHSRLWRRFSKVRTELGLPGLRLHDLRHSTATLLLSLGVYPKVAQEILGHSQIRITLHLYSGHVPAMPRSGLTGCWRASRSWIRTT
ncbi:MAG: tyrosine-type recombinase/integrase [Chloroflexota bacterium]